MEDHQDASLKISQLDGKLSASASTARPQTASTSPSAPLHPPSPSLNEAAAPAKTDSFESQPMTSTSSASSTRPAPVQLTMEDNGPSPYGTRSRHRTGNARVNYAEDRELDMDYDWAPASKKARGSSTSASSTNLQAEDNDTAGVNTRRRSLTTAILPPASKGGNTNLSKEQIPGLSSFSVHPGASASAPQPSKKRKAPGTVPAAPASTSTMPNAANNQVGPRKAAPVASTNGSRTTNMLSFDVSQGFLKNGELKADDGTALAVNGTYLSASFHTARAHVPILQVSNC